jgi:hypothetical protein
MGTVDLRLRNLESSELLIASFENEVDAMMWLRERPPMMEVLGVIAEREDPALHHTMRTVVRPLDADEAAIVARLDAADEVARAEHEAREAQRARDEAAAHREAMRNADPNRPMQLSWSIDEGFSAMDPVDEREISAEVREAVLAWVRERDEWVAERGLVVGEATLTVWPGVLPAGESRVQPGGHFVPVLAPPKTSA